MAIDRRFTMEHKRKIGLALRGNKNFLGKKHSERSKHKMSESRKRLYAEGKMTPWNKGLTKKVDSRLAKVSRISSRPKTLKHRRKIGEAHRKLWGDPDFRKAHIKQFREKAKLQWQNPEFRSFMEDFMRRKWKEEEYRKEHSIFMKALWANDKFKQRQMKRMLKGLLRRPTSLELQFINICEKYGLPFEYVGDGELYIGSRNPDFVHRDGKKICVEVANTYKKHHVADYEQERKRHFSRFGWRCIVFMGNKLDETSVLSELRGVG